MATVLPHRPKTNSTGSTASRRHASLNSFPSHSQRSGSHSTQGDSGSLAVAQHRHTLSNASHKSSGTSYRSSQHGSNPAPNNTIRSPQKRPPPRKVKPIKSQYPPNSTEKHVEYILVASFDIDRGSIMEHQYPGPVGGDEHMLAELMLPDQAHVRSQDWTIFFLHKDAGAEEDQDPDAKRRRRRRRRKAIEAGEDLPEDDEDDDEDDEDLGDDSDDDSDDGSPDGPPLVYVLNLVNTKHDNTIKRGAIVKAMAICTRHSFLHIYKPLLLLALEQYFANPMIDTLASLYEAVNSMDLSLMPRLNLNEKFILQATDAKDLFLEKFEAMIAQRMAEKDEAEAVTPAIEASAAQLQSKTRYGLPRDTHEFESVISYANVPVPVKIPTAVSPETVGDFSLIKLITTFSSPHSSSPTPFNPTHPHLTTSGPNTHPIIVLLNALLTQKRVIFLGHNLPSADVAEAVLAACALASGGMLRGFTRHAFPYTDLTKIDDLLRVPGFIAGVTNPAFANKTEWWDVLCDLSTGKMRISNKVEQAPLTEGVVFFHQNTHQTNSVAAGGISSLVTAGASLSAGLGGNSAPSGSMTGDATGDGAFMQSVLAAINERHGENAIRGKFRKWVVKFTRLASSFEETVYGASALHIHNPDSPKTNFPASAESPITEAHRELPAEVIGHGYVWPTAQSKNNELAANATRIEGWRNTRSYYNFIQDLASFYVHRPIKHLDLQHLHDKLAKLRLGHEQSANIYLAICEAIHTEAEISHLLSIVAMGVWENKATSAGSGQTPGLLYIGTGLFHPRLDVREEVAELLGRIREHEAGRHFWLNLGRFIRIGWERTMTLKVERLERGAVQTRHSFPSTSNAQIQHPPPSLPTQHHTPPTKWPPNAAPPTHQPTTPRPHWKRPKHQGGFQPKNPENHGKNSYKKAHTVNDLKKTVRNITRLLERELPANIRVEKERQLQTATRDLANAEKAKKRSEVIGKYHKIRFFDRQKAERRLKKAKKGLKEAELPGEKAELKRKVEECEVDVNYAMYAPLEWEYVSLFPTRRKKEGEEGDMPEDEGGKNEVEREGDKGMWERVRVCMEEGTLGDLREGRLDKVEEEEDGEKVVKKGKSVKKKDSKVEGKKVPEQAKDEDEEGSGDESGGGFFE